MPSFSRARFVLLAATIAAARASASDYVGAERCAACHPTQYEHWQKSGHASALARLSAVQQKDATCRTCHTMIPSNEDPAFGGVQCESCHGAGRLYEPDYVMRDAVLAELYGLAKVEATTCAPCHTADAPAAAPFVFADKVEMVRHEQAMGPASPDREPKK